MKETVVFLSSIKKLKGKDRLKTDILMLINNELLETREVEIK